MIIEIALGIVLAVVILAFWQVILVVVVALVAIALTLIAIGVYVYFLTTQPVVTALATVAAVGIGWQIHRDGKKLADQ